MFLGQARTPPDTRIYAIGDVHGCDRPLAEVHAKIVDDLAHRPIGAHRIIHVGDYVDRGPQSAAVIDRLLRLRDAEPGVVCLGGNHEEILLGFLTEPAQWAPTFLRFGGVETIASYGVAAWDADSRDGIAALRDRFAAALPGAHLTFFRTTPESFRCGDYFFCHAGIRPGVPLDAQRPEDLRWIREQFLTDTTDHGAVVIHGHTPVEAPEICRNRINIDTGAVFGGRLTCLVLEGARYEFL